MWFTESSFCITVWAFTHLNQFDESASVNGAIVCMINNRQDLPDFHQKVYNISTAVSQSLPDTTKNADKDCS